MPIYVRTQRIEAMQWRSEGDDHNDHQTAERIVAWVKANGGEARYEPEVVQDGSRNGGKWFTSRIAVRTRTGWHFAELGDYVVRGELEVLDLLPPVAPNPLRYFSWLSPEEFEAQGWAAAPEPEES